MRHRFWVLITACVLTAGPRSGACDEVSLEFGLRVGVSWSDVGRQFTWSPTVGVRIPIADRVAIVPTLGIPLLANQGFGSVAVESRRSGARSWPTVRGEVGYIVQLAPPIVVPSPVPLFGEGGYDFAHGPFVGVDAIVHLGYGAPYGFVGCSGRVTFLSYDGNRDFGASLQMLGGFGDVP